MIPDYLSDFDITIIFTADNQIIKKMQEYISRNIDKEFIAWKDDSMRKPLLLRDARQVGKRPRLFGQQVVAQILLVIVQQVVAYLHRLIWQQLVSKL